MTENTPPQTDSHALTPAFARRIKALEDTAANLCTQVQSLESEIFLLRDDLAELKILLVDKEATGE